MSSYTLASKIHTVCHLEWYVAITGAYMAYVFNKLWCSGQSWLGT